MTHAAKYVNGLPQKKPLTWWAQENALLIKVNGRAYSVTTCSSSNNIILAVGLENFNERLKHPEGFYLGNAARERKWNTSNSKLIYNGFCRYSLRSPDN